MAAKPVPAAARRLRALFTLIVCFAIFLSITSPVAAQKEKKKKKDANAPADTHTTIPMPDEQQIDYNISEMLGAWQLGDVDRLRQTYADDVVFVSGVWAPPVFGWSNFLPLYHLQRAHAEHARQQHKNPHLRERGSRAG